MSDFIEIQLDPKLSYGSRLGLSYTTTVVRNTSRKETRFQMQSRGYWDGTISLKDKSGPEMSAISAFYSRVNGKTFAWRFRNYREYYTCIDDYAARTVAPEPITTYAGGTTMQLIHTRNPGLSNAEIVPVTKPDMNSMGATSGTGTVLFQLFRDGSGTPWPSAGNWALDTTTGIVTFNTSQTGHTFSYKGYWDTPMRFDDDSMSASQDDLDVYAWDGIKIVEVQI